MLNKYPEDSNQCFAGDIWTIFLYSSERKEHLKIFLNYFNSCHKNIKFTSEKETNNKLSFLDTEISRDKNQFITLFSENPHLVDYFPILLNLFPGVINSS